MKTKKSGKESGAKSLREKAEEKFKTIEAAPLGSFSPDEIRKILHELRVHQIELEIQNEELLRIQEDLEISRSRYFDLFDLAPVGYLTISEKGLILGANLTAAGLLGVAKSKLVKQPFTQFICPDNQDIYYRHRKNLFETGLPQVCELRMLKKEAPSFWARINATVTHDPEGKPVCRASIIDITQSKQAEEARRDSEAKLTNALKIAHLGPWEYDVINDLFTFNDSFYAIFRTNAGQVGGYTMPSAEYARRFVHPDDIPVVGEEIRKAIESTDPNFSRQ